jgi:hypothetical protein
VFDARNILDAEQIREAGLTYIGTGRNGLGDQLVAAH